MRGSGVSIEETRRLKWSGKYAGAIMPAVFKLYGIFALKENPDMDALMYLSYFFRSNQEFQ
jgi:hypothetical protein